MKANETSGSRRKLVVPDCSGKRFAIVAARFYQELSDWLVDGAKRALRDCHADASDVVVYDVPGCFELPIACRRLIDSSERVDGVVAVGVVIRGETPHFDFVAGECARGIMDIALLTGVPIGFGVLTTENLAQAQERADPKRGDKGYEAAIAAATLIHVSGNQPRAGFR
ncbi:MAG: 6,7-dimethyl-8-ribityllumazine synthase [Candidatus Baltobacteraceae bacterium]